MTLPDLMPISDYDPTEYIDEIYKVFKSTLVDQNIRFLGRPITYPWHQSYDDKHFCFWHCISKDSGNNAEDDRIPDMRRCERIAWIAYVLEHADDKERIWCWEKSVKTKRGRNRHINLYLHEANYLVVLRRKNNRLEFITAYVRNENKPRREKDRYDDPR